MSYENNIIYGPNETAEIIPVEQTLESIFNSQKPEEPVKKTKTYDETASKIRSCINSPQSVLQEMQYNSVVKMLENEKQLNKTESWNKLDKLMKIQKLHGYAEKYGTENNFTQQNIKLLKFFFNDALDKGKLQKVKEVLYDKDRMEIISIPSLTYNPIENKFALKNTDIKWVSTTKSLTPKRIPEKNK
jgi:hypothetical protein